MGYVYLGDLDDHNTHNDEEDQDQDLDPDLEFEQPLESGEKSIVLNISKEQLKRSRHFQLGCPINDLTTSNQNARYCIFPY